MTRFSYALLFSSLLMSSTAMAQESIFAISEKQDKTYIDLGISALSTPEYLGSDDDQVRILPFINAEYKGRLFLNPYQGAGVNLINDGKFRVSGSAYFAPSRKSEDTPFTDPSFDIDGGALARASARYLWKYAAFDVTGSVPVFGDMEGAEVEFRATTLLPISDTIRIGPSIFAGYQTSDWLNTLYGVNTEQALAAGLTELSYSDGFGTYGAAATAFVKLPADLSMIGILSYTKLDGSLKDSPLTPRNDGIMGAVAISKRF